MIRKPEQLFNQLDMTPGFTGREILKLVDALLLIYVDAHTGCPVLLVEQTFDLDVLTAQPFAESTIVFKYPGDRYLFDVMYKILCVEHDTTY